MTRSAVKVTAMTNIHCYPFTTMQDMIIHNPVVPRRICNVMLSYPNLWGAGKFFSEPIRYQHAQVTESQIQSHKCKAARRSAQAQGSQPSQQSHHLSECVQKEQKKIISWLTWKWRKSDLTVTPLQSVAWIHAKKVTRSSDHRDMQSHVKYNRLAHASDIWWAWMSCKVLVRHSWKKRQKDKPGRHSCRTILEDIPVRHSGKTLLEDTPETFMWLYFSLAA